MLTDAHCHPFDLSLLFPQMEQERRRLGVLAAASACGMEEFTHNETLAHNAENEKAVPLLLCYGVHPQLPAVKIKWSCSETSVSEQPPYKTAVLQGFSPKNCRTCEITNRVVEQVQYSGVFAEKELNDSVTSLQNLASAGRITAIGECGFDLYNTMFKETEKQQDALFSAHLEIAIKYSLPIVLHIRRAMDKVFAAGKKLSKCKAVVFHSWSGTLDEAQSLLRHGINAYFSFGNTVMLNHKQAIQCCSLLPLERLLTETDSPFQPRRGEKYSVWADLPLVLKTAADIRSESGNKVNLNDLETQIEINFRRVFYSAS